MNNYSETKPKVILVDKDDNPIGLQYRDKIDHEKEIYRVTGIWIENSKGQVLIAQRQLTKLHDPGKWGPAVAGTIEEGETYESNAYKELEEELGLINVKLELGPKTFRDGSKKHFTQWFVCVVDLPADAFKLQEEEVEAVAWIDKVNLVKDVKENPDKYIPSFPKILASLIH